MNNRSAPPGAVVPTLERARAFGARIISPPATYPFGERQYTAEDTEGHRWSFTQSVADIAPGAWGATAAGL
jgi:uncharacterized glyoxalase superfamily protein PhnB